MSTNTEMLSVPPGEAGAAASDLSSTFSFGSGRWEAWAPLLCRTAGMPFDWIELPAGVNYETDLAGNEVRLAAIMAEPRYREAVLWQNPGFYRARIAGRLPRKPSDRAQVLRTAWAYATRYCAKNDLIGHFGPVVWGRWVDGATTFSEAGRPARAREVFFERHAVARLAGAVLDRHQLDRWTVPRLSPAVQRSAAEVLLADGGELQLDVVATRLLDACDGRRTLDQVVAELAPLPVAEVLSTADRLRRMRLLTSGFVVPRGTQPERVLAAQLLRITDADRRAAAQRDVASVVAGRDAVAAAAGADELDTALTALESTWSEITGGPTYDRAGQFYAGRTTVYSDCLGDVEVKLSTEVLHRIGSALELVLHGARWYCDEVARRYEDWLRPEVAGADGLPLAYLVEKVARAATYGGVCPPAAAAAAELRKRWEGVLLEPGGATTGRRRGDRRVTSMRHATSLSATPADSPPILLADEPR